MLPFVGTGEAGSLHSMGYAGLYSVVLWRKLPFPARGRLEASVPWATRWKMNSSCALCLSASLRERYVGCISSMCYAQEALENAQNLMYILDYPKIND